MNCFLICRFITSCPYKSQQIINHYHDKILASHFTRRSNRANPIYPNYSPRCKTEDCPKVGTNPPWSINLSGFTSLTILLHINKLSWPIPLALYFMKCKMIYKMPVIIMHLFENRKNFIRERAFSGFFISFNIEEMLIRNLVFDTSLFNSFFFGGAQIV